MVDVLQRGADWLAGKLNAHASHMVTYVRGGERLTLSATFGRTAFEAAEEYGLRLEHTDRDFIVRTADFVLGGLHAEPKTGDRIEEMVGGTVRTYEVMKPTGTEQPYRFSDANRMMLRIHTKLVSVQ